jgi:hypothetical protein
MGMKKGEYSRYTENKNNGRPPAPFLHFFPTLTKARDVLSNPSIRLGGVSVSGDIPLVPLDKTTVLSRRGNYSFFHLPRPRCKVGYETEIHFTIPYRACGVQRVEWFVLQWGSIGLEVRQILKILFSVTS